MKGRRKLAEAEAAVVRCARDFVYAVGYTGTEAKRELVADAMRDLAAAVFNLDDIDLPDPDAGHGRWVEGAPETSRTAALTVPKGIRREIVMQVASTPKVAVGLTDQELEHRLRAAHTTVSAARNHLVGVGWLADSGCRRLNKSRRPAVVWEITPAGWSALQGGVAHGSTA